MIPLTQFLLQSYDSTVFKVLSERLFEHLMIEFDGHTSIYINEKHGEVSGSHEVAAFIWKRFNERPYESGDIDVSRFMKAFNAVHIEYEKAEDHRTHFEYDQCNDDTVFINAVIAPDIDSESFVRLLKHEILHAYEDKNRKHNGALSLDELISPGYLNSISTLNSKLDDVSTVSKMLYFLDPAEVNAHMSALRHDVKEIMKKHNWNAMNVDMRGVLDELKKLDIWKEYVQIGEVIVSLKKGTIDERFKKSIHFIYRSKMNDMKIPMNAMIRDLWNRWTKFIKKIEKTVPKICLESLEPVPRKRIDFV